MSFLNVISQLTADTSLSPPRTDKAGFRIPKKHIAATSRDRIASSAHGTSDGGRDQSFSKKSHANPPPSKIERGPHIIDWSWL
ncbi:hypothetical protein COOONC_06251 [Cooperia oncophora]